tara:strand:+ start:5285 stop:6052 length:768 start_codon:yes stop_codon:yes gene_type:complete
MYRFLIYSRKSKDAQDGHTQHTHATAEYIIRSYLKQLEDQGIPYTIEGTYEENISGSGYYTKRPIFRGLVERCKEDKGLTLLVSKADRLARNVRTGAELMETINFVLANAPDADDLQKHLEFTIAEREGKITSNRFKDTYKAKKKRCEESGEKFIWGGNSPKWKESMKKNKHLHKTTRISEKCKKDREPIVNIIKDMLEYSNNALTLSQIAEKLNSKGITTVRGKPFSEATVSRIVRQDNIPYKRKHKCDNVVTA